MLAYDPIQPSSINDYFKDWGSKVDYSRQKLSKVLGKYNHSNQSDDSVRKNCTLLKQRNTFAVVTGQQSGLFTGPLYTIFKIITTINLAKYCSDRLCIPVVPIFWNATEDHDVSEVSTVNYPNMKWSMRFPHTGKSVDRFRINSEWKGFIKRYLESIPEINHKKEINHLLSGSFIRYGDFASSFISKLFFNTGLIILEPFTLRAIDTKVFEEAIKNCDEINSILWKTAKDLQRLNLEPAFVPDPLQTGLYYVDTRGFRRRILKKRNYFLVNSQRVKEDELIHEIRRFPHRFSPSAYLRPIFQSSVLPNILYVAGPSEFLYHLQLRPLYDLFQVPMPVIRLRNHATLFSRKEQKLLKKT